MVKIIFNFIFAAIVFSTNLFAQESIVQKTDSSGIYKLTDVVISATKTQSSTLELANSISIIDSSEISNKVTFNIFDALKNEYGLSFTQQGNKSGVSNVFIRGANSSHTLVLIDGVEVNLPNDPSNFYDFANLSIENVDRIEVLRGPQSTLYGSDALAGVINIITIKGSEKPVISLKAEGGSYNTFKGILSSTGSIEKFNYSIALSRIKSDGFSAASEKYGNTEKDGQQSDNINANIVYNFSETFNSNILLRFNKAESDLDQSIGTPDIWDDPTYIFKQQEFFVRGQGQLSLFKNNWDQTFGITFFRNVRKYSYDTSNVSIFYPDYVHDYSWSTYDGRKYKFDWLNYLQLNKLFLFTAGVDFEINEYYSDYYAFNYTPDPNNPDIVNNIPKEDVKSIGIFLQDQFNVGESFFGTIGIRLDNVNQFGTTFTYRIAPAYVFWQTGTKIKATIGTGFKAPSLFYLYDPTYGNESLNPEKSFGLDAGIEQFFGSSDFSAGANYFYNKFDDMFGFDPISFKTINIKKAETNGIEIFTKVVLIDQIDVKANYTYTNAKDKSENTVDYDKRLVRRPEHKAGLFASYSYYDNLNINMELFYVGTREEVDFANFPNRIVLPDYFLVNLAAHYDLYSFLRLQGRIENLFDIQYEEVYGYGTAGFSVYGGISLRME